MRRLITGASAPGGHREERVAHAWLRTAVECLDGCPVAGFAQVMLDELTAAGVVWSQPDRYCLGRKAMIRKRNYERPTRPEHTANFMQGVVNLSYSKPEECDWRRVRLPSGGTHGRTPPGVTSRHRV